MLSASKQVVVYPMSQDTKDKLHVYPQHQMAYTMEGFRNGKGFQDLFYHELPGTVKIGTIRIAITYRLTAKRAQEIGFKPREAKYCVRLLEGFASDYSYSAIADELKSVLKSDETFSYGKWHANSGRTSCELLSWDQPSAFEYVYGKKPHQGQAMGAIVKTLADKIKTELGQEVDWAHVVKYSNGEVKLGKHKDDEKEIAPGSSIFCVVFLQNESDVRRLDIFCDPDLVKKEEEEVPKFVRDGKAKRGKEKENKKETLKKSKTEEIWTTDNDVDLCLFNE